MRFRATAFVRSRFRRHLDARGDAIAARRSQTAAFHCLPLGLLDLSPFPRLDFIHALTYVFAAALAGRRKDEGWPVYVRWIRWVWQGEVAMVIAELAQRQNELGLPPDDASETDPRQIVCDALTYLQNQQSRMKYPDYRKQGLPITSSHMESTIKQMNERIKGSEKFWCERGGEAVLQLRADMLSDTQPLVPFWANRAHAATGTRSHQLAV
jgi:hypothetical protein